MREEQQVTKEQMDLYAKERQKLEEALKNATDVKCSACECTIFKKAIGLKRVSSMDPNNPTGEERYIEFPAMYCLKCKEELKLND